MGKGTYGNKMGRPKKQPRSSKPFPKTKIPMKTNRAQTAQSRKKRKR